MGAACCVAAKDKTIQSRSNSENLHRNVRCSPTWSFRWDHRGRVAGEDTSINWFSDGVSRNDGSENKNESAHVSEDGSPLQNCQRNGCQKSPISEGTTAHVGNSTSGNIHEVSFLVLTMDLLGLDSLELDFVSVISQFILHLQLKIYVKYMKLVHGGTLNLETW